MSGRTWWVLLEVEILEDWIGLTWFGIGIWTSMFLGHWPSGLTQGERKKGNFFLNLSYRGFFWVPDFDFWLKLKMAVPKFEKSKILFDLFETWCIGIFFLHCRFQFWGKNFTNLKWRTEMKKNWIFRLDFYDNWKTGVFWDRRFQFWIRNCGIKNGGTQFQKI